MTVCRLMSWVAASAFAVSVSMCKEELAAARDVLVDL